MEGECVCISWKEFGFRALNLKPRLPGEAGGEGLMCVSEPPTKEGAVGRSFLRAPSRHKEARERRGGGGMLRGVGAGTGRRQWRGVGVRACSGNGCVRARAGCVAVSVRGVCVCVNAARMCKLYNHREKGRVRRATERRKSRGWEREGDCKGGILGEGAGTLRLPW